MRGIQRPKSMRTSNRHHERLCNHKRTNRQAYSNRFMTIGAEYTDEFHPIQHTHPTPSIPSPPPLCGESLVR